MKKTAEICLILFLTLSFLGGCGTKMQETRTHTETKNSQEEEKGVSIGVSFD